jgi:hypothetical protein
LAGLAAGGQAIGQAQIDLADLCGALNAQGEAGRVVEGYFLWGKLHLRARPEAEREEETTEEEK